MNNKYRNDQSHDGANAARFGRRDALKAIVALPLAASSVRLWAAPKPSRPKLLVVFLRGGYDCASLLVPTSSSFYYESRPNIAIAKPVEKAAITAVGSSALTVGPSASTVGSSASAVGASALPLDADWGLHPALAASLHPLWQAGQLAFVPFAGIEDTSRSHFATQDAIELGQPLDSRRDFQSGFMNRLASIVAHDTSIAFSDQLPVTFRGAERTANVAIRNVTKSQIDARQTAAIAAMYRDTAYATPVSDGFAMRDALAKEMMSEMEASARNAVSATGFELEARRIARLMRDRYALGFVDVGGWDTHVGQGGASGVLATRFNALGRGLAALATEMGPAWNDTTVVVMSEFGRTFRENGNRGTDHGHGSVYWVLGGGIRGGRVAGEQVKVDATTLFQDRDYPVLNEYRAVLGGLAARMYGLSNEQVQRVFAGSSPRDVGVI